MAIAQSSQHAQTRAKLPPCRPRLRIIADDCSVSLTNATFCPTAKNGVPLLNSRNLGSFSETRT